MKNTRLKLTHVVLAIVAFGSCTQTQNTFDATGTFEANEIIISAENQGKIVSLNVEEGDKIKEQNIIGLIDTQQLYYKKALLIQQKKALQRKLPNIDIQIASVITQINTAKKEKNRIENLYKEGAASQKQLDDITGQITVLEKQLRATETTLNTNSASILDEYQIIQTQIDQINDQINRCIIKSPIDATVIGIYLKETEMASIGKALLKIGDIQNMYLRAYVDGTQLNSLKLNQKVRVATDIDLENMEYHEGTITWISEKAEFTPKTIQTKNERNNLVYAVKIKVPNNGKLKIGMYGEVLFQ